MATSPLISKASNHTRSVSSPSIPHPIAHQFEELVLRLKSSQTSSSSSISDRLSILNDVYGSVDELLLMPTNQKTIVQDCQAKWIDDMLDGSLKLLDICGTARDALLQTKESIQGTQSLLRRRCNGEVSMETEIAEYLNTRRNVRKAVKICLRDIRKTDKHVEASAMISMFEDVEDITADVLKSSLAHIANASSKKSSWSLVSKLVSQKSGKEEAPSTSEFEEVDVALSSLINQKKKTGIDTMKVDKLRSQMIKLESEIQDVEEALGSLFRHLVKTRGILLNILSN